MAKDAIESVGISHDPQHKSRNVARCVVGEEPPSFLLDRLSAGRPGMPICLITGFLGAGKTTLVNHILVNEQGVRAAVFVNEYGSVDVDGALIRSQVDEDNVVSLTNGCVCCEVNADLAKQLSDLLKRRREALDIVIIETSGVCNPEPVLATLQQIEDVDQVHLDSVICVVDASTVQDAELGSSPDAQQQLTHADVILFNKVDLLSEGKEKVAKQAIVAMCKNRGVDPVPPILCTTRAQVELAAILGFTSKSVQKDEPICVPCVDLDEPIVVKRRRLQSSDSTRETHVRAKHSRFATFTYSATKPFDMLRFEEWASNVPDGIVRAKGLIWMRAIPRYVAFHLAGRRTNPFETLNSREIPSSSAIVFICHAGTAVDEVAIRKALDSCLC